jgi:hypothetical protein
LEQFIPYDPRGHAKKRIELQMFPFSHINIMNAHPLTDNISNLHADSPKVAINRFYDNSFWVPPFKAFLNTASIVRIHGLYEIKLYMTF